MTQMDLLDLLAPPAPEALDRDADVLGCFLGCWMVARIVRALDNPQRLKEIRAEIVNSRCGGCGPEYRYNTEPSGLHVRQWYEQATPWIITWPQAIATVRIRATPALAEVLLVATAANKTTFATQAQRDAAHAILPNRWYLRWYAGGDR